MASAAEQFASNFSWSDIFGSKDLRGRVLFTLGALIVYRIGTYIPIPGVNPQVLNDLFHQSGSGGLLGMFNNFTGGALKRMTVFALSIMPYISASIIMQLLTTLLPSMAALKKEGVTGQKVIQQNTRYLTVLIATLQAYGIAMGLERITGPGGASAVVNPSGFFVLDAVVSMVGGTLFLMWLGEQITQRGIGNGVSLIIYAGIVASVPRAIKNTLELSYKGTISPLVLVLVTVVIIAVIFGVVFMERAFRKVMVQYPGRQQGRKLMQKSSSHIPLKINTSGVIPPIFASALLIIPTTALKYLTGSQDSNEILLTISSYFSVGSPVYLLLYSLFIGFFAFFYTAIVFNPEETAENLRKNGGIIPGIRPGSNTAEYFDYVLIRLTTLGAFYLILVCLLPQVLYRQLGLPFYFGGTSLLIVVSVTLDTVAQIHSHVIAKQYEGLMKKNKFRGM